MVCPHEAGLSERSVCDQKAKSAEGESGSPLVGSAGSGARLWQFGPWQVGTPGIPCSAPWP